MNKSYTMNKRLITLAIAAALAAPMTASAAADSDKIEAKFFGYTQITAAVGKGSDGNSADDLRFGADSIRLGYKIEHDKIWGKLQIDFNKTDNSGKTYTKIGVPEIIKDAVVGYKFSDAAKVRAGLFKTPVGMDFSNASKQLDITKRGMETGLVLERAAGLMVSGRNIGGGFGYDIGTFNPAKRSSAVSGGIAGTDSAYAGRVIYETKALHVEASYGSSAAAGDVEADATLESDGSVSTKAAVTDTEDYTVVGVAGSYKTDTMNFKAEYVAGSDVKGKKGYDESVWYLHAGYAIHKKCEIVLRHYAATSKTSAGVETELGNTYIGWNIFLAKKKKDARIQLNYVVASGDETTFSGKATGKYAYTDNIFLAQFQVGF